MVCAPTPIAPWRGWLRDVAVQRGSQSAFVDCVRNLTAILEAAQRLLRPVAISKSELIGRSICLGKRCQRRARLRAGSLRTRSTPSAVGHRCCSANGSYRRRAAGEAPAARLFAIPPSLVGGGCNLGTQACFGADLLGTESGPLLVRARAPVGHRRHIRDDKDRRQ